MKLLPPPLPAIILDPIVRLALSEDLGRAGDLTTDATIAPETQLSVVIAARQPGVRLEARHTLGREVGPHQDHGRLSRSGGGMRLPLRIRHEAHRGADRLAREAPILTRGRVGLIPG